jgi:predicted enzyme related to lactoylglutathione lyase
MSAMPPVNWTTLTVDCSDAEALGAFYSRLLGWEITARDGPGWLQLRNPHGGVSLNIQAEDSFEPRSGPSSQGAKRS